MIYKDNLLGQYWDPHEEIYRRIRAAIFNNERLQTYRSTHMVADDDKTIFTLDLPGVKVEDISVCDDNGLLKVEVSGDYCTGFKLQPYIDVQNITAHAENGRLVVTLPHLPDPEPRKITVTSTVPAMTSPAAPTENNLNS